MTYNTKLDALLEIQVDNIYGNNLIAKIVNMDDADRRTHGESMFLVIRTNEE